MYSIKEVRTLSEISPGSEVSKKLEPLNTKALRHSSFPLRKNMETIYTFKETKFLPNQTLNLHETLTNCKKDSYEGDWNIPIIKYFPKEFNTKELGKEPNLNDHSMFNKSGFVLKDKSSLGEDIVKFRERSNLPPRQREKGEFIFKGKSPLKKGFVTFKETSSLPTRHREKMEFLLKGNSPVKRNFVKFIETSSPPTRQTGEREFVLNSVSPLKECYIKFRETSNLPTKQTKKRQSVLKDTSLLKNNVIRFPTNQTEKSMIVKDKSHLKDNFLTSKNISSSSIQETQQRKLATSIKFKERSSPPTKETQKRKLIQNDELPTNEIFVKFQKVSSSLDKQREGKNLELKDNLQSDVTSMNYRELFPLPITNNENIKNMIVTFKPAKLMEDKIKKPEYDKYSESKDEDLSYSELSLSSPGSVDNDPHDQWFSDSSVNQKSSLQLCSEEIQKASQDTISGEKMLNASSHVATENLEGSNDDSSIITCKFTRPDYNNQENVYTDTFVEGLTKTNGQTYSLERSQNIGSESEITEISPQVNDQYQTVRNLFLITSEHTQSEMEVNGGPASENHAEVLSHDRYQDCATDNSIFINAESISSVNEVDETSFTNSSKEESLKKIMNISVIVYRDPALENLINEGKDFLKLSSSSTSATHQSEIERATNNEDIKPDVFNNLNTFDEILGFSLKKDESIDFKIEPITFETEEEMYPENFVSSLPVDPFGRVIIKKELLDSSFEELENTVEENNLSDCSFEGFSDSSASFSNKHNILKLSLSRQIDSIDWPNCNSRCLTRQKKSNSKRRPKKTQKSKSSAPYVKIIRLKETNNRQSKVKYGLPTDSLNEHKVKNKNFKRKCISTTKYSSTRKKSHQLKETKKKMPNRSNSSVHMKPKKGLDGKGKNDILSQCPPTPNSPAPSSTLKAPVRVKTRKSDRCSISTRNPKNLKPRMNNNIKGGEKAPKKNHKDRTSIKKNSTSASSNRRNLFLKCLKCNMRFAESDSLRKHSYEVHTSPSETHLTEAKLNESLECEICFKKYRFKRHLERHKESHVKKSLNTSSVSCSVCLKIFKKSAWLKKHVDSCKEYSSNSSQLSTEDLVTSDMKQMELNLEKSKQKVVKNKDHNPRIHEINQKLNNVGANIQESRDKLDFTEGMNHPAQSSQSSGTSNDDSDDSLDSLIDVIGPVKDKPKPEKASGSEFLYHELEDADLFSKVIDHDFIFTSCGIVQTKQNLDADIISSSNKNISSLAEFGETLEGNDLYSSQVRVVDSSTLSCEEKELPESLLSLCPQQSNISQMKIEAATTENNVSKIMTARTLLHHTDPSQPKCKVRKLESTMNENLQLENFPQTLFNGQPATDIPKTIVNDHKFSYEKKSEGALDTGQSKKLSATPVQDSQAFHETASIAQIKTSKAVIGKFPFTPSLCDKTIELPSCHEKVLRSLENKDNSLLPTSNLDTQLEIASNKTPSPVIVCHEIDLVERSLLSPMVNSSFQQNENPLKDPSLQFSKERSQLDGPESFSLGKSDKNQSESNHKISFTTQIPEKMDEIMQLLDTDNKKDFLESSVHLQDKQIEHNNKVERPLPTLHIDSTLERIHPSRSFLPPEEKTPDKSSLNDFALSTTYDSSSSQYYLPQIEPPLNPNTSNVSHLSHSFENLPPIGNNVFVQDRKEDSQAVVSVRNVRLAEITDNQLDKENSQQFDSAVDVNLTVTDCKLQADPVHEQTSNILGNGHAFLIGVPQFMAPCNKKNVNSEQLSFEGESCLELRNKASMTLSPLSPKKLDVDIHDSANYAIKALETNSRTSESSKYLVNTMNINEVDENRIYLNE